MPNLNNSNRPERRNQGSEELHAWHIDPTPPKRHRPATHNLGEVAAPNLGERASRPRVERDHTGRLERASQPRHRGPLERASRGPADSAMAERAPYRLPSDGDLDPGPDIPPPKPGGCGPTGCTKPGCGCGKPSQPETLRDQGVALQRPDVPDIRYASPQPARQEGVALRRMDTPDIRHAEVSPPHPRGPSVARGLVGQAPLRIAPEDIPPEIKFKLSRKADQRRPALAEKQPEPALPFDIPVTPPRPATGDWQGEGVSGIAIGPQRPARTPPIEFRLDAQPHKQSSPTPLRLASPGLQFHRAEEEESYTLEVGYQPQSPHGWSSLPTRAGYLTALQTGGVVLQQAPPAQAKPLLGSQWPTGTIGDQLRDARAEPRFRSKNGKGTWWPIQIEWGGKTFLLEGTMAGAFGGYPPGTMPGAFANTNPCVARLKSADGAGLRQMLFTVRAACQGKPGGPTIGAGGFPRSDASGLEADAGAFLEALIDRWCCCHKLLGELREAPWSLGRDASIKAALDALSDVDNVISHINQTYANWQGSCQDFYAALQQLNATAGSWFHNAPCCNAPRPLTYDQELAAARQTFAQAMAKLRAHDVNPPAGGLGALQQWVATRSRLSQDAAAAWAREQYLSSLNTGDCDWKVLTVNLINQSGQPPASQAYLDFVTATIRNTNEVFNQCCVTVQFAFINTGLIVDLQPNWTKDVNGVRVPFNMSAENSVTPGTINVYVINSIQPSGDSGLTNVGRADKAAWIVFDPVRVPSNPAEDPLGSGLVNPGYNLAHELGHLAGLDHPHNGTWTDDFWPRDNFMAQGGAARAAGGIPNNTVMADNPFGLPNQCEALRAMAR